MLHHRANRLFPFFFEPVFLQLPFDKIFQVILFLKIELNMFKDIMEKNAGPRTPGE